MKPGLIFNQSEMKFFMILFLIIFCLFAKAQQITISGVVSDEKTGELLIGANVYDKKSYKGSSTNTYGFYSLTLLEQDSVYLFISFIGYQSKVLKFKAVNDTVLNFQLSANNFLDEVEVVGRRKIEERVEMGVSEIPIQQIKLLPAIGGEVDVIKAFQLMPGVQSGKEGTSAIYVRGGSPDQNLFLLDGVPLYYVSHVGGFVSTFDPNAINSVKLTKGGFPARYGGRLSAVVDIHMKEGNKEKKHGEYMLGIATSKLTLEGPLKRDTSSYLFSLRRSNFDLFTRPVALWHSNFETMVGYTFYDLNVKTNRKLSEKTRLFTSIYTGRDRIFITTENTVDNNKGTYKNSLGWGNYLGSVRLNHIWSPRLFTNFTLAFTKFYYTFSLKQKDKNTITKAQTFDGRMKFSSGVQDILFKCDGDYFLADNHKIKTGISGTYHHFTPGAFKKEVHSVNVKNIPPIHLVNKILAGEVNAYLEDEWMVNNKLSFNLGVHGSAYFLKTDHYYSIQPRILGNYMFEHFALKGSYSRMMQFIHLLSNSGVGLPMDLWVPSTGNVVPEIADQYSLGLVKTLKEKYELSVEGYYKNMTDLIELKEGVSFIAGGTNWEDKVEKNGIGEAYGVEFLLQKKEGRTTGWIAYTWSKNRRKFEGLNKGEWFPYRYDRPHDFSIVLNHQVSEGTAISATWVYNTGTAVTVPFQNYQLMNYNYKHWIDGTIVFDNAHLYPPRNASRMPDYHRLDVGAHFSKKKRKGTRTWNVGLYNVYNRQNPFFLFYKENKAKKVTLHQLSIFTLMPSFSYSYKF